MTVRPPLLLTCAAASVPTQQARLHANALLSALRRGRLMESGEGLGRLWSGPSAPNPKIELPASPLMASLHSVFRRQSALEARMDRGEVFSAQDALRYDALRQHLDELIHELRQGQSAEPGEPTVAGLYALHVPHAVLLTPSFRVELLPASLYREVTLHDDDPIFALLAPRLADPRKKGPAFKFDRASGTLQRDPSFDKRLSEWLTTTAADLRLTELRERDHVREDEPAAPDPYARRVSLGTDCY